MQPHRPPDRLKRHGKGSAYEKAHEHIKGLLAVVESSSDAAAAVDALMALHANLDAHFAEEEEPQDGVFYWLETMDPDLIGELRSLAADHISLRAELDALLASARAATGQLNEAQREATVSFSNHLRKHERREFVALKQALGES